MYRQFYIAVVVFLLFGYAVVAWRGYELGTSKRQFVPADVRHAAGGYRSFHFWHTGYHGGK